MTGPRRISFVALLLILGGPLAAGAQNERVVGTIVERAPVTLSPEAGRTPLVTLEPGTQVRVMGAQTNGWYRITFQHGYLFGDRVGYVRVEHLKIARPSPGRSGARSTNPPSSGAGVDDIASAILAGQREVEPFHGLELPEGDRTGEGARFRLRIHTPLAWIRQLASDAAREHRSFTRAEVTDEMMAPVLRVTVYSARAGTAGRPSPVRHVVLRSHSRDAAVEPLSKEAVAEHVVAAGGGRAVSQGLRLTFPMDAVRRLRGPQRDAEFLVSVIDTSGRETHLTLTMNHFARLPM